MSERHPLPSGNWIELRDWREMRRGDKKRIMGGVTDLDLIVRAGYEVADGLLAALVTNWSYSLPVPSVSMQSLDLLPIEDDDPMMALVKPAMEALFPRPVDAGDPQQVADPASPTGPSAG